MDKQRPAAPPLDKKTRQRRGPHAEPPLPHEHDESSDSQRSTGGDVRIEKAAEDVAAGRKDTTKGDELDRTYQRQKPAG